MSAEDEFEIDMLSVDRNLTAFTGGEGWYGHGTIEVTVWSRTALAIV
ncbi:hypothetical protein [Actinoplanes sp. NPDC049802]